MAGKSRDRKHEQREIDHVIVSLLDSGLSIFHHSFVQEEIDPDLFSALITATSMQQKFSSESTERVLQERFQIENYTANVCHGEYLAGIMVASSSVPQEVLTRFLKFLASFEEEYKFLLRNWHGDRTFFDQSWALDQLMQNLAESGQGLQLQADAMQKAESAIHIRLTLLIKRHEQEHVFSKEHLLSLLSEELQIPNSQAISHINDLVNLGIISEV